MSKYDYDVLTIGLGPAGMAVSGMAQGMGLRVCSVEKHRIGGECMNVGCIPSKAILRVAKTRHAVHKYDAMSLEPSEPAVVHNPFPAIQKNLEFINESKNKMMLSKVDMVFGEGPASFVDEHRVQVGERVISAHKIFICAGTQPSYPPIEGIKDVDCLDNRNIFEQDGVPQSLMVIGGGAIACEMAQAFGRLGSTVTIVIRGDRLLKHADADAAELVTQSLIKDGIRVVRNADMRRFSQDEAGIRLELGDGEALMAQKLLVACGRKPSFDAMKLENVGIERDERGYVKVNKHLRTNRRNIYAVGDCNGHALFSHAAMHQGMVALMNSLAPPFLRKDYRKFPVPYTMFTDPAVSWVGETREELEARGVEVLEVRTNHADYGAAIAEHVPEGYVKVLTSKWGRILGAGVVGEGSADMINEWGLAIQNRMRMTDVMFLQHSFPSMSFLNKRASEIWMMQRMKNASLVKRMIAQMARI